MKNEVNKFCTTDLAPVVEASLSEPLLYQVVILNDDFTPMEFVAGMLEKLFFMDRRSAMNIMLQAHIRGRAAFGRYTRDVAETKVARAVDYARMHEHPLNCSMEAAE